jgi:hypothetical protein
MDDFAERDLVLGWELTKSVWAVPQGFGNDTSVHSIHTYFIFSISGRYWKSYPTGQEFIVQSAIALNHGAKGVVSWNDPTTPDIQSGASQLAKASLKFSPFLFSASATFRHYFIDGVDVGVWKDPKKGTFVLATNTAYIKAKVPLIALLLKPGSGVTTLLDSGAKVVSANIVLEGAGTGAFVFAT